MSIVKEIGSITNKGAVQSGVSKAGNNWYRQTIVVEVAGFNGSYRKIALQASGEQVADIESYEIGDKVEVAYKVTAREYDGKWYNNVDLYNIRSVSEQNPTEAAAAAPAPAPKRKKSEPIVPQGADLESEDDMPF